MFASAGVPLSIWQLRVTGACRLRGRGSLGQRAHSVRGMSSLPTPPVIEAGTGPGRDGIRKRVPNPAHSLLQPAEATQSADKRHYSRVPVAALAAGHASATGPGRGVARICHDGGWGEWGGVEER